MIKLFLTTGGSLSFSLNLGILASPTKINAFIGREREAEQHGFWWRAGCTISGHYHVSSESLVSL
jgi:hypothetical protein